MFLNQSKKGNTLGLQGQYRAIEHDMRGEKGTLTENRLRVLAGGGICVGMQGI